MAGQQAVERMRSYLWSLVEQGALSEHQEMADTVLTGLQSTNPEWVPAIFKWAHIQGLNRRDGKPEEKRLFREPRPEQLKGRILIGHTVPNGYPVSLPLQSFGQRAHVLVTGTSGTGKSTLLNFMAVQLMEHVPVTIYDFLNQSAPVLVPHLPAEKVAVLDFSEYRRGLL